MRGLLVHVSKIVACTYLLICAVASMVLCLYASYLWHRSRSKKTIAARDHRVTSERSCRVHSHTFCTHVHTQHKYICRICSIIRIWDAWTILLDVYANISALSTDTQRDRLVLCFKGKGEKKIEACIDDVAYCVCTDAWSLWRECVRNQTLSHQNCNTLRC